MNASPAFQRLLWKEYRVLRQLWAMCGLGGSFLMLVILAVAESQTNWSGYSTAFWSFTVWVPPVYVFAALATMFAGEREEGTLVWLTTLSPRLPSVFLSRVLFVLTTGVGLQLWYALVALVLSHYDDQQFARTDADENLRMMSFLLVESLAYGLFWSLQTNRPLNAILYAAVMLIVVNSGAAILVDALGGRFSVIPDDAPDYALSFWGWARCLLIVAVMAANWRLAEGWLHGRPWDWEWVGQWWSRRRVAAKTATGPSTVAALPAEAVEPWRRAWQRLRWLEWQSLKTFAWLVLALSVASWASILVRFERQPPTFGWSASLCWIALLLAGLLSWQGEQTQQRFRALVRLGVAPLALWANKLLCWMLAGVAAVLFITATTALQWTMLAWVCPDGGYSAVSNQIRQWMATPGWWEFLPAFVTAAVTMFASAFVSAHSFRRTVIAFGFALIGSCLTLAWFFVCGQVAFPVILFFVPIPLWLLWISASTLPGWWTEQRWWHITKRRGIEIAAQTIVPIVILVLAAGYRIWEVPTVEVVDPNTVRPTTGSINAVVSGDPYGAAKEWDRLAFLLQHKPVISSEWSKLLDSMTAGRQPSASIREKARDSLVEANEESLQTLMQQTLSVSSIPFDMSPKSRLVALEYPTLLAYCAQTRLAAGRSEESLQYLQSAARLSGMLQRFTPVAGIPNHVIVKLTLNEMIAWAQHPAQTEETLRRGLQLCAAELRYWQPQVEELYLLREWELEQTKDVYWSWERERARKLADVAYSNRWLYLTSCQQQRLRPGRAAQAGHSLPWWLGRPASDPVVKAWQFTLPEERFHLDSRLRVAYGLGDYRSLNMHEAENQYRATLARMAVVGHRRLHGTLPLSLFDVEHYFGEYRATMYDVWSGSHFGYAPTGFTLKEPEFKPASPFRQPLLWTVEALHYSLEIRDNFILRWTDVMGFNGNAVTRSGDEGQQVTWIFPIPATDQSTEAPAEKGPETKE